MADGLLARLMAALLASPALSPVADMALAPLWNRRNAALNDAALEALALSPDDRVLEVGFGGGYLLGRMASVAMVGLVAGVDVSPGMVARCRRRCRKAIAAGRLDVQCAPAERLPFAGEAFDKGVSVNSLFYWPDAAAGMREMVRVLAPGGRLVLCLTCRECTENRLVGQVVTGWDLEGLHTLAIEAGFRIVSTDRLVDRHRQYWRLLMLKPLVSEAAAAAFTGGSEGQEPYSDDAACGDGSAGEWQAQAGANEQ